MTVYSKIGYCLGGIILSLFIIRRIRVYQWGRCKSKRSLKGKTVIITGANSGIGKATALELAKRDARVIMACRNFESVVQTCVDIRYESPLKGELVPMRLDLASLQSVQEFVKDFVKTEKRCHILINNAGVFQCPYAQTAEGFEMQMGVNHLGHFLLTVLLQDTLKASAPSRVVVVSSSLAKNGTIDLEDIKSSSSLTYNKKLGYYNSKLANLLFARELHNRLQGSNVGVFAVTPGMTWTKLGRHVKLAWWKMLFFVPAAILFIRTPAQGCQTIVHCAVDESLDEPSASGKFYRDCRVNAWYPNVENNPEIEKELWKLSEKLTIVA